MTESLYLWSKIAASNDLADPGINWQEGQLPGSVNASTRSMMATLAKNRDDINGTLVPIGTNALTISAPNTTYDALYPGIVIGFKAAATNTGNMTLDLASKGAKPIRIFTSAGEVAVPVGAVQQGGHYRLEYDPAAASGGGAWILLNPSPDMTLLPPSGTMMPSAIVSFVPSGWLLCFGQAVSRTTFPLLFAAIGIQFGAGDGSTTFNLPDMRGRAAFGRDDMGGTAANRITTGGSGISGIQTGAFGGAETVTLTLAQIPVHGHGVTVGTDGAHSHAAFSSDGEDFAHTHAVIGTTDSPSLIHTHGVSGLSASSTATTHSHSVSVSETSIDLAHTHTYTAAIATASGQSGANTNVATGTGQQTGAPSVSLAHSHGVAVSLDGGGAGGSHSHPISVSFSINNADLTHSHSINFTSGGESRGHTHGIAVPASGSAHTHAITVQNNGSGQAHAIMPPALILNWIIKT